MAFDLTAVLRLRDEMSGNLRHATDSLNTTNTASGKLGGALKTLGGIVAGAIAVDKIKDLGVEMVTAAADASAMNAQFEQVFGELGPQAEKAIAGMGKEFDMVGNRLKPAMSGMTSMFMGLGLDTKKAMGMATEALTVSADASAFYDKSMEDAQGSLTSFLKGNYEAGESIGIFGSAAAMETFALKEMGQEFKTLDEAGKQLVRLEFAKSMQESAGATGQAARESESLQNQLGNVKQLWTDLMAKFGEGILPIVIAHLKNMADNLRNFDPQPIIDGVQTMITKFMAFKAAAVPVIMEIIAKAKEFANYIKTNWTPIKETLIAVGAAVIAMAATFKTLQIIGVITTLIKAYRAGTLAATLATYGLNTALLMNPLTWIILGIGLLVGAIVYLVRNFDWAKQAFDATWKFLKTSFMAVIEWLKPYVMSAVGGIILAFTTLKDYIVAVMPEILAVIKFVWEMIWPIFKNTLNNILSVVKVAFTLILDIISYTVNNIVNVVKIFWNLLSGIFKVALELLTGQWSDAWESFKTLLVDTLKAMAETFVEWITGAVDIGKNFVKGIIEGFVTAWKGLVDTVSSLWSSLKSRFTGEEINVGVNATTRYSGAVPSGVGVQASAYHGMSRVPYDGMVVKTHKNEAILDADEASAWRAGKSGGGVTIAKLADQIIVREEADVDRIADKMANKIIEAMELGA